MRQIRAQLLGSVLPEASRTHSGWAVVPVGTSVGHGLDVLQVGEQNGPLTPVMVTSFSSDLHGPESGSP